tara:strand:- start:506 stop:1171 length:666 start_codon:yes stop_codon:yes gene_type:complete
MNISKEKKPLIIIGAGGQAANIANIALDSGIIVNSFIDEISSRKDYLGVKVYNSFDHIKDYKEYNFAIGVGENFQRQQLYIKLSKTYSSLNFPVIKHPSAVISSFSNLGEGSILMPNTIVGANARVGSFCILGNQACIGHDSEMSNFSSLGPGSITGGTVSIGERVAIGINASIKEGIKVEEGTVLGASSYLDKNLPKNIIAYGTPAIKIRDREKDEHLYL